MTAAALFFIHKVTFNYLALIVFVAVAAAAHAAIGFVLSLKSKDFTTMLVALMGYMFIFTIPSLLFSFGAIAEKYEWLLMLSPSHSCQPPDYRGGAGGSIRSYGSWMYLSGSAGSRSTSDWLCILRSRLMP